jgi:hypothetical protein
MLQRNWACLLERGPSGYEEKRSKGRMIFQQKRKKCCSGPFVISLFGDGSNVCFMVNNHFMYVQEALWYFVLGQFVPTPKDGFFTTTGFFQNGSKTMFTDVFFQRSHLPNACKTYFFNQTRDRCYDHNFLRFLTIFGEKNLRFPPKPTLWSKFLKR